MLRALADLSTLSLRDVCCHPWLFFASANLWAIESTELDTQNSGAQAARCWSRRGEKKKIGKIHSFGQQQKDSGIHEKLLSLVAPTREIPIQVV